MIRNMSKLTLVLLSALIIALVGSLSIYFFIDNVHVTRTFFFPERTGRLSGEIRRLPEQKSSEAKIELFVNELILGPFSIDHERLVPENTKLLSLMFRDGNTVYLDFSADLVVHDDSSILSLGEMVLGIKKNIFYDFPFVKKIIVSVDGEQLPPES